MPKPRSRRPMNWMQLATLLTKHGATEDVLAVAKLAYVDGVYNGLFMLGQTTTADRMVASWHEYYSEARADFSDEMAAFVARSKKGGGSDA